MTVGDTGGSYNFADLGPFVERMRDGYDLVLDNRSQGGIEPGAMLFLHRCLEKPGFPAIGKLFFRRRVGDFQCDLRGFRKVQSSGRI